MKQQRLGKGLGALIGEGPQISESASGLVTIDVNDIDPSAAQPRKHFDNDKLGELAQSIKTYGIVQPIIVQKNGSRYTIVAGERRYRAARLAGLAAVPVVVKECSKAELMEVSLVENLQREDLNPIEEAEAMRLLMREHNLTQDQLSSRLGKSRSSIANTLRLLNLPDNIRDMVISGLLSSGHARCLITLESDAEKQKLAERIIKQGLSVRAAEQILQSCGQSARKDKKQTIQRPEIDSAEKTLTAALGTKVQISGDLVSGRIILAYYNKEQLQTLFDFLMTCK
ncbi:MAG: ParB/RepB/Spo0J family partition protein [Christensenellales bacterium]